MDLFEERRSIRKYTSQPVTDEVLHQLIEAARVAPSGNHTQPWYFIAVRSEETKRKIVKADHDQEWMMGAPLFLVCVADGYVRLKDETIELNEETPYKGQKLVLRDTAIATEHIALKAVEPVSYTHLQPDRLSNRHRDLLARDPGGGPVAAGLLVFPLHGSSVGAVSYTHLDVYKRQDRNIRLSFR